MCHSVRLTSFLTSVLLALVSVITVVAPRAATQELQPDQPVFPSTVQNDAPSKLRMVVFRDETADAAALAGQLLPGKTPVYVYRSIFSGVQLELTDLEAEQLTKNPEVAGIYEVPEPQPGEFIAPERTTDAFHPDNGRIQLRDLASLNMMKVDQEAATRGKGMVVAVIDSGVADRPGLRKIDDLGARKYQTADQVRAVLRASDGSVPQGRYLINDKIAYYGACSPNTTPDFDADGHGSHVSGIMTNNPDQDSPGVAIGVLPQAQLVAFNCGITNRKISGDYSTAIDRAVALGAQIINLSFGTTGGNNTIFQQEENANYQAMKRAYEKGTLISISAGNSAAILQNGDGEIPIWQPNPSTLGTPSVTDLALSVASANVQAKHGTEVKLTFSDHWWKLPTESSWTGFDPTGGDDVPFRYLGTIRPNTYYVSELAGKIIIATEDDETLPKDVTALLQQLKQKQARGLAIVCAKTSEPCADGLTGAPAGNLPVLLLHNGSYARDLASAPEGTFWSKYTMVSYTEAGQISQFSSWGTPADLDFIKPDITAPGGRILSTTNTSYAQYDGTSMASPNVGAAAALVMERLRRENINLAGPQLLDLTTQLLQSYATPLVSAAGDETTRFSPRVQGAGLVNIRASLAPQNTVVAVGNSGRTSVMTSALPNTTAQIPLRLRNFGASSHTYNSTIRLSMNAQENTDTVKLVNQELEQFPGPQLNVSGNDLTGSQTAIAIDLTQLSLPAERPHGFFVDGWIDLHAVAGSGADDLHLPFTIFVGNGPLGQVEPGIEQPYAELSAAGKQATYAVWAMKHSQDGKGLPYTGLYTRDANKEIWLGENLDSLSDVGQKVFATDEKYYWISPNGDGIRDALWSSAAPIGAMPGAELKISAESDSTKFLATHQLRELIAPESLDPAENPARQTDLSADVQQLRDGEYQVQYFRNTTAEPLVTMKFGIDRVAPHLRKVSYDAGTGTLTINNEDLVDQGSPIKYKAVLAAGEEIKPEEGTDNNDVYQLAGRSLDQVYLDLADYAGNTSHTTIAELLKYRIELPQASFDTNGSTSTTNYSYEVTDSAGNLVQPDDLPGPGTYRVRLSNLGSKYDGNYPVASILYGSDEAEVTVTEEQRTGIPNFDIRTADSSTGTSVAIKPTTPVTAGWMLVPMGAIRANGLYDLGEDSGFPAFNIINYSGNMMSASLPAGQYRLLNPSTSQEYAGGPITITENSGQVMQLADFPTKPLQVKITVKYQSEAGQAGPTFEEQPWGLGYYDQFCNPQPVATDDFRWASVNCDLAQLVDRQITVYPNSQGSFAWLLAAQSFKPRFSVPEQEVVFTIPEYGFVEVRGTAQNQYPGTVGVTGGFAGVAMVNGAKLAVRVGQYIVNMPQLSGYQVTLGNSNINVAAGQTASVDFTARELRRVTVNFVGADPVEELRYGLWHDGEQIAEFFSIEDQLYLDNLPDGTYELWNLSSGSAAQLFPATVELVVNGDTEITVAALKYGTVKVAAGPLNQDSALKVHLENEDTSIELGAAEEAVLPIGTYRVTAVSALADAELQYPSTVEVKENEVTSLPVAAYQAVTLTVQAGGSKLPVNLAFKLTHRSTGATFTGEIASDNDAGQEVVKVPQGSYLFEVTSLELAHLFPPQAVEVTGDQTVSLSVPEVVPVAWKYADGAGQSRALMDVRDQISIYLTDQETGKTYTVSANNSRFFLPPATYDVRIATTPAGIKLSVPDQLSVRNGTDNFLQISGSASAVSNNYQVQPENSGSSTISIILLVLLVLGLAGAGAAAAMGMLPM